MQRNNFRILTLLFSFFMVLACKSEDQACQSAPDVSQISIEVSIEDYTSEMVNLSDNETALNFIHEHPFIEDYFFERKNKPNDSVVAQQMLNIFTNEAYQDTLYHEVNQAFGDFEQLKADYQLAFQYYTYYYPETEIPKIEVVLAGLRKDLYVSDALISIAADYFLGPEASFVPNGIPEYILMRYQKEYIVPMTMLLLTQKHNKTNSSDQTLLADMIFYGKSYYLAKQTIPCTPDSLLLGYTAKEINDINENEHIIWANFLENDLLYETSHFMKNKFIGERPKTSEISLVCPGRIGIWVGWQIIKSYMANNPEVTVQELMNNSNAQDIFSQSKYKPRN